MESRGGLNRYPVPYPYVRNLSYLSCTFNAEKLYLYSVLRAEKLTSTKVLIFARCENLKGTKVAERRKSSPIVNNLWIASIYTSLSVLMLSGILLPLLCRHDKDKLRQCREKYALTCTMQHNAVYKC